MEIKPQNVCEVLRALRTMPDSIAGSINLTLDSVYCVTLLKTAHHIEEHNKLPSLKQIRRWQTAALKINESCA